MKANTERQVLKALNQALYAIIAAESYLPAYSDADLLGAAALEFGQKVLDRIDREAALSKQEVK